MCEYIVLHLEVSLGPIGSLPSTLAREWLGSVFLDHKSTVFSRSQLSLVGSLNIDIMFLFPLA